MPLYSVSYTLFKRLNYCTSLIWSLVVIKQWIYIYIYTVNIYTCLYIHCFFMSPIYSISYLYIPLYTFFIRFLNDYIIVPPSYYVIPLYHIQYIIHLHHIQYIISLYDIQYNIRLIWYTMQYKTYMIYNILFPYMIFGGH